MGTKKNKAHCDYQSKCKLPAYVKVYYSTKNEFCCWSFLCRKHFKQIKKKKCLKSWTLIDANVNEENID